MKREMLKITIAIMALLLTIGLTGCSDDKASVANEAKTTAEKIKDSTAETTGNAIDTAGDVVVGEKCGEGKCGDKAAAKKCGEGKCGDKAAAKKCGEGKCGDSMKDKAVDAVKGAVKGKCGADKMQEKAIEEVKEVVKDKISG